MERTQFSDQGTIQFDEAALIPFLQGQADVAAAYLFGSRAQGRAHPQSDVDIALLLDEEKLPPDETLLDRRLYYMTMLEGFAATDMDVVILNDAPPILRHEVLSHGRLIYEANRELRVTFEVNAGKIYEDLRPLYEFFGDALSAELEGAGFGRPR